MMNNFLTLQLKFDFQMTSSIKLHVTLGFSPLLTARQVINNQQLIIYT